MLKRHGQKSAWDLSSGSSYRWDEFKQALQEGDNEDILSRLIAGIPSSQLNAKDKTPQGKTLLHIAVQKKRVKAVQLLLNYKVNSSISDVSGREALYYALNAPWEIAEDQFKVIRLLVDPDPRKLLTINGVSLPQRNAGPIGETPLHTAILNGLGKMIPYLLKKSPHLKVKNTNYQTVEDLLTSRRETSFLNFKQPLVKGVDVSVTEPLFQAVCENNLKTVQKMIAQYPRVVEAVFGYGQLTILQVAVRLRHVSIIRYLLKVKGVNVNAHNLWKSTVLHEGVRVQDLKLVQSLVALGAHVHSVNEYGATPLLYAVFYGHTHIANYLLQQGATLDVRQWKESVLHIAIKKSDWSMSKLLLAWEMPVNVVERQLGQTVFHYAVHYGHADILELLLNAKPPLGLNTLDRCQKTALHYAIQNHSPKMVQLILAKKEARVNVQDAAHYTPLHYAVSSKSSEKAVLLNCLLKAKEKLNLDATDKMGVTALHLAVQNQCLVSVTWLIEQGASVNIQDKSGYRALYYSIKCSRSPNSLSMTDALIKKTTPACLNSLDQHHQTLLHYAVQAKNLDCIKLLVGRGAQFNIPGKIAVQGKMHSLTVSQYAQHFLPKTAIAQFFEDINRLQTQQESLGPKQAVRQKRSFFRR